MSFEVVEHEGALVVFGRLTFPERLKVYERAPRGSTPNVNIAQRLGASFVWATPSGVEKLMRSNPPACERVQREVAQARAAGLSDEACVWLDGWTRGVPAADALFGAATGIPVGDPQSRRAFPDSAEAFGACVDLQRRVPEVAKNLRNAGGICRNWHRLVQDWDKLARLYVCGALERLDAELELRLQLLQLADQPTTRAGR